MGEFAGVAIDAGWDAYSYDTSPEATAAAGSESVHSALEDSGLGLRRRDALVRHRPRARAGRPARLRPGSTSDRGDALAHDSELRVPAPVCAAARGCRRPLVFGGGDDHLWHFTADSLRRLLEAHGFRDVRFHYRGVIDWCVAGSSSLEGAHRGQARLERRGPCRVQARPATRDERAAGHGSSCGLGVRKASLGRPSRAATIARGAVSGSFFRAALVAGRARPRRRLGLALVVVAAATTASAKTARQRVISTPGTIPLRTALLDPNFEGPQQATAFPMARAAGATYVRLTVGVEGYRPRHIPRRASSPPTRPRPATTGRRWTRSWERPRPQASRRSSTSPRRPTWAYTDAAGGRQRRLAERRPTSATSRPPSRRTTTALIHRSAGRARLPGLERAEPQHST